jgi:hypothetical protein
MLFVLVTTGKNIVFETTFPPFEGATKEEAMKQLAYTFFLEDKTMEEVETWLHDNHVELVLAS